MSWNLIAEQSKKWIADLFAMASYAVTWLADIGLFQFLSSVLAFAYLFYRVKKERSNSKAAKIKEDSALLEKELLEEKIKKIKES